MKPKLRLETRQEDTLLLQLICNCCGQPYYPNKSWEDRIRAIVFGTEKYAICPLCTQEVPSDVFLDEGYRRRCHREVARIQHLFELQTKAPIPKVNRTAQPTHGNSKPRVPNFKEQARGVSLRFKVGQKGGVSVYGFGRFPTTLYYEQWLRLLGAKKELCDFLETNKTKLKRREPE